MTRNQWYFCLTMIAVAIVLFFSLGHSIDQNQLASLSVGMSEDEVIRLIGKAGDHSTWPLMVRPSNDLNDGPQLRNLFLARMYRHQVSGECVKMWADNRIAVWVVFDNNGRLTRVEQINVCSFTENPITKIIRWFRIADRENTLWRL